MFLLFLRTSCEAARESLEKKKKKKTGEKAEKKRKKRNNDSLNSFQSSDLEIMRPARFHCARRKALFHLLRLF